MVEPMAGLTPLMKRIRDRFRRCREAGSGKESPLNFWDRTVAQVRRSGGSPRDVSLPPGVLFFENLYLWERAVMEPISGRRQDTLIDWFWRTYVGKKVEKALSVSCGTGYWERRISSQGYASAIDAFDASAGVLRWARDLAREKGLSNINYRQADLNTERLPAGEYDVVVSVAALHHLLDLEHGLDEIRRCLKPGGYLVFDEYVGPNRMQWSDRALEIVNEILSFLPARLRVQARHGIIKEREERVAVEKMKEIDPTEAARSEDILPLVKERFERVEVKPYGGALLMPLFMNIIGNFDSRRPEDRLVLDFCLELEKILLREKILDPIFVLGVAQKQAGKDGDGSVPVGPTETLELL